MKKILLSCLLLVLAFVLFSFANRHTFKAPSRSVSKTMVFPVSGKGSNIGSRWGARRDGGRRKHKGIDIFARKGTPVVAISDGLIVHRDRTPIGGRTLWLKSADHPWTAYYAHLDRQLVAEGQYVRKGQVIGTVGKTGNARTTPPHLHFGISRDGGWVDPLPYVKYSPKVRAKASQKATVRKKSTGTKQKQHRRKH